MIDIKQMQNKIVLVRVGFDLPSLEDVARIEDAKATIKLLTQQGNKVVLASKWGRPKAGDEALSMKNMIETINTSLNVDVEFINQFASFSDAAGKIKSSGKQIFVLENTHFEPKEKSKDSGKRMEIARQYAILANFYVDEAFPSSHRKEATNCEIKELLPWSYGLAYQNELENLNKIKEHPISPLIVVMAGAKLETKLPLIGKILPKADKIILGGLLSFTFVKAATELGWPGLPPVYDSMIEEDFLDAGKEMLENNKEKLILPVDYVYETEGEKTYGRDVGPKTLELFKSVAKEAKTLFWNGTLGFYEKPPFDKGTLELASFVINLNDCFKAVGGGDTNSSFPEEIISKFDFVSMGGGATLEYLSK